MDICKYYQKGIYNSVYKIVAIGDIHGDLDAFIRCLVKGSLVDSKLNWTGGKTHVVQLGDVLDRKSRSYDGGDEDSEFKIIDIIAKLQVQSRRIGGAYHCIIGNHEIMNVLGDIEYASPLGINHFGGARKRIQMLKSGSMFAKYLSCFWNPIIKIGNWIFSHGGVNQYIAGNYKIEQINLLMRKFLFGEEKLAKSKVFKKLFLEENSLLWNREYSGARVNENKLVSILNKFNAKYLVIGHTPQEQGINSSRSGIVWRVDSAMSNAFGKKHNDSRIQILVIINNGTKIKII